MSRKVRKLNCKHCGKALETVMYNKKFCNDICAERHRGRYEDSDYDWYSDPIHASGYYVNKQGKLDREKKPGYKRLKDWSNGLPEIICCTLKHQ